MIPSSELIIFIVKKVFIYITITLKSHQLKFNGSWKKRFIFFSFRNVGWGWIVFISENVQQQYK